MAASVQWDAAPGILSALGGFCMAGEVGWDFQNLQGSSI